MVATNLKAETFSLMEKRDAIETEMNAIIDLLCRPGGPGISGNLIDSEGFPRSDIDIPSVRSERHRLSELRNDYRDITEKISDNLQVLHSGRLAQNVSLPSKSPGLDNQVFHSTDTISSIPWHASISEDFPSAMDEEPIVGVPFAMVDEIADASPAAEDGIQLGDQIVKFGNVEIGEGLLPRLSSEAQSNQGHAIPLVIMRLGAVINLTVTPRPWHGRGLLGCHFRLL
ncbi:26S proteasome regulatory subunit [Tasmannia lanceolata]|uniref:26S proteasome regulatory subunit n=1 Tax=Tasmannia lanceolata TaxID=3420 RepID=UPI0040643DBF